MAVSLRILDDGAWLSVGDSRRIGVGEMWRVRNFCDCSLADLVVEGFTDVGVDGRTVEIRAYGTCIACSEEGTTGWLPVGRTLGAGTESTADTESTGEGAQPRQFGPLARTDNTPLAVGSDTEE